MKRMLSNSEATGSGSPDMLSEAINQMQEFLRQREETVQHVNTLLNDIQQHIQQEESLLESDVHQVQQASTSTAKAVHQGRERLSDELDHLRNRVIQLGAELQRGLDRLEEHAGMARENDRYIQINLCEKYNAFNATLQKHLHHAVQATNLFASAGQHVTDVHRQDQDNEAAAGRRRAIWQNNVGILLGLGGQRLEAEHSYTAAQALSPDLPHPWINRAVAVFNQGRYDEAHALLLRDETPPCLLEHPAAQNLLGLIAAKQGKWDEARTHFEQAVLAWPYRIELVKNLALAYRKLKRYLDWDRAMLQAAWLNPLDTLVADWLRDRPVHLREGLKPLNVQRPDSPGESENAHPSSRTPEGMPQVNRVARYVSPVVPQS